MDAARSKESILTIGIIIITQGRSGAHPDGGGFREPNGHAFSTLIVASCLKGEYPDLWVEIQRSGVAFADFHRHARHPFDLEIKFPGLSAKPDAVSAMADLRTAVVGGREFECLTRLNKAVATLRSLEG